MSKVRTGTVKQAKDIDWSGDWFGRTAETAEPGVYVYFISMWKGPFETKEDAKDAYREWKWEYDHS